MGLVHKTMGLTLLMGTKGRYTIIEQSNTLLKESLHSYTLPCMGPLGSPDFYRALIFSYIKPVFIGLSSYITRHNTATCDVRK